MPRTLAMLLEAKRVRFTTFEIVFYFSLNFSLNFFKKSNFNAYFLFLDNPTLTFDDVEFINAIADLDYGIK